MTDRHINIAVGFFLLGFLVALGLCVEADKINAKAGYAIIDGLAYRLVPQPAVTAP